MTDRDAGEGTASPKDSPPRSFPVRRVAGSVTAGAFAGAGVFFWIGRVNSSGGSPFTVIGIAVYAAVVMGIAGLVCAAILRATWPLAWGTGTRGVLMMIVGATAGAVGGIRIITAISDELPHDFRRYDGAIYVAIVNTIVWTIGGAISRLPRSPRESTSREIGDRPGLPKFTIGTWWALIATVAAVIAIDCASWLVESRTPRRPEPGPTLATWNAPRLTRREELMTHVWFAFVINLALAATILGSYGVIRRFRRGEAGPGTAVIVLALLPLALIGVGGTIMMFLSIFR